MNGNDAIHPLMNKLSEIQETVNEAEATPDKWDQSVRISFLRNFTIEGIDPFLRFHCYRSGIKPHVVFGNYDTIRQEIFDTSSHLHVGPPDLVVLSLVLEQLDPTYHQACWRAGNLIHDIEDLFAALLERTTSLIAVNTFIPPFENDFGITNVPHDCDRISEVAKINEAVKTFAKAHQSRFILVDWERIARVCGEQESIDYRFWYMSRAPFKKEFLNACALEITKIVRALRGKSKKCLVLDCDNTLWGGVIGEDGLHGIKLDNSSYPGNVFHDFQQTVLNLYERGVLIALCSKNNEEDVWDVIDNHPHCLVRRSHIVAWRINWNDKVGNLKSLAQEMNIGLDSFVFVDDNPVECEMVASALPEITVIQVPQKLFTFPRLLMKSGLFDTLSLSDEDRKRAHMYHAEALRKVEALKYENIEQYLSTLNIVAVIHEARKEEIPRIAQLTQKTNQFNVTTRRYSEAQIEGFANDPDCAVFSLSVRDKFGDSGLTGVLIVRRKGTMAEVDSLLISCRVLGRKLENVFLFHCLSSLNNKWGVREWHAEYLPTRKNQQVEDFFEMMGFSKTKISASGKRYALEAAKLSHHNILHVTIEG